MKGLIIGAGEVGQSLKRALEVTHRMYIRDREEMDVATENEVLDNGVDVLNVCYPYSERFETITESYIRRYRPGVTIIHSTVPVGTSRKLGCVHSPIHGRHPNLTEGIQTFVKYVGGADKLKTRFAWRFLKEANLNAVEVDSPETSELSKILCTTYLGVIVSYMYRVKELCDRFGADFKMVYGWNDFYNVGYQRLGLKKFTRPRLDPPDEWKGIGGHCVIENALILRKEADELTRTMIDYVLSAGKDQKESNDVSVAADLFGKGKSNLDLGISEEEFDRIVAKFS